MPAERESKFSIQALAFGNTGISCRTLSLCFFENKRQTVKTGSAFCHWSRRHPIVLAYCVFVGRGKRAIISTLLPFCFVFLFFFLFLIFITNGTCRPDSELELLFLSQESWLFFFFSMYLQQLLKEDNRGAEETGSQCMGCKIIQNDNITSFLKEVQHAEAVVKKKSQRGVSVVHEQ